MKNYLFNITWKCQLTCSYCWVMKDIRTNPVLDVAPQRTIDEWTKAIERDTPDIATMGGGEPLSVPWAVDLIRRFPDIAWALSTNGLNADKINEIANSALRQIININLSYHPEAARKYTWYNDQWKQNILRLKRAGYNVTSNVEKVNQNVERSKWAIDWLETIGSHMLISPICGGRKELFEPQETSLICEGGVNHLVIAPDGNAWPCQTALNSYLWKETCLGNWIDGELDLSKKPVPCHLYCVEYNHQYKEHEAGDFFYLNVRRAE